ncbi:glycosyltransferase family 9 protein [Helicobacter sp. 10-6591]|uniref:glycosyltransferase family 9 protein n=1 Tax=Helicobacter sp. 10-6591 TaxID=2004998 RepID=UPI000DCB5D96|nr:glycosyltransferase family 9 protein [Helicobacter sp. 10-6591]RAX54135.1 hypothetical protein CCY97_06485 [Helicobacter sp. 10-6591]
MQLKLLCGNLCEKKHLRDFCFDSKQIQERFQSSNASLELIIFVPKQLFKSLDSPQIQEFDQKDMSAYKTLDFIYLPDKNQERIANDLQIPYFTSSRHTKIHKFILKMCKRLVFGLLDFVTMKLAYFCTKHKRENLVIVRTDAIGDYVLFRNFLPILSQQYGKITLIGNSAFLDLALGFDKAYLQKFIPLHPKEFERNVLYRIKTLYKLSTLRFHTLINPIFSRDRVSEVVSRAINAKEKIASIGDKSNLDTIEYNRFSQTYTLQIGCESGVMFEFERNAEFVSNLLQRPILPHFSMDIQTCEFTSDEIFSLPSPYVVFFIGASAPWRKWSIQNFYEVGLWHIKQGFYIVICGGKEDSQNGETLVNMLNTTQKKAINLCGKTSLRALARIVYNGNHLLSNETSCPHIAACLRHDINIYVVYNGNHLYRFIPYPKRIRDKYYAIFHPIIEKNLLAYGFISNYLQNPSKLDINCISAQSVIDLISTTLKNSKDYV